MEKEKSGLLNVMFIRMHSEGHGHGPSGVDAIFYPLKNASRHLKEKKASM